MNPLPPIPLHEGHFLIDNSSAELIKCPRLYELQALRRRVLSAAKAGRNFGSTLHAGWAVRYRQAREKAVTPEISSLIQDAMRVYLDLNPQPMEDFRNFDHACRVMEAYNEHYGIEPFKILTKGNGEPIVEASFALPFGSVDGIPILYCGKIDIGVEDNNGIWSFDHKSTYMFGENWEATMQMDSGQIGYCWALKKVLPSSVRVNGYIINGVRIRKPKKQDEYMGTAPVDSTDLIRIPFFLSDDTIDEWQENVLHTVEDIFHWHKKGFFPQRRSQCVQKWGKCDMFDVCTVSRESRQGALDSNMYEPNTWTPLKGVDE